MSDDVIKILDALSEKIGLSIDWTSQNVVPYINQLCRKYVNYEITTSVIWIILGVCVLFFAIKCGPMLCRRFHEKYEEDEYSAYDLVGVLCGVATVILVIVGIIVITAQMFDIATCMTFPEKIIVNEIQSIYQSVK